jgi:hypothetical protein
MLDKTHFISLAAIRLDKHVALRLKVEYLRPFINQSAFDQPHGKGRALHQLLGCIIVWAVQIVCAFAADWYSSFRVYWTYHTMGKNTCILTYICNRYERTVELCWYWCRWDDQRSDHRKWIYSELIKRLFTKAVHNITSQNDVIQLTTLMIILLPCQIRNDLTRLECGADRNQTVSDTCFGCLVRFWSMSIKPQIDQSSKAFTNYTTRAAERKTVWFINKEHSLRLNV